MIYQTGTSWKLKQRKDCWISQICPDHWFWGSRHLEMEPIWYLGPSSFWCASESCPTFSPGSVWHLSFTRVTTPPQPCTATLIFIIYCSRLRDSARHSKPCNSVIFTSSILACMADKQPNTELMNKSQYSTYTLTETRRSPIYLVYFWLFWSTWTKSYVHLNFVEV